MMVCGVDSPCSLWNVSNSFECVSISSLLLMGPFSQQNAIIAPPMMACTQPQRGKEGEGRGVEGGEWGARGEKGDGGGRGRGGMSGRAVGKGSGGGGVE